MVDAIEKEKGSACVPPLPWAPAVGGDEARPAAGVQEADVTARVGRVAMPAQGRRARSSGNGCLPGAHRGRETVDDGDEQVELGLVPAIRSVRMSSISRCCSRKSAIARVTASSLRASSHQASQTRASTTSSAVAGRKAKHSLGSGTAPRSCAAGRRLVHHGQVAPEPGPVRELVDEGRRSDPGLAGDRAQRQRGQPLPGDQASGCRDDGRRRGHRDRGCLGTTPPQHDARARRRSPSTGAARASTGRSGFERTFVQNRKHLTAAAGVSGR